MNKIAVACVALLCLVQVQARQGDVIKDLLDEKIKELAGDKNLKPLVLAAAPTSADEPYVCNINDVITNSTQLIENTLDIFQKTFSVGYSVVFAGSINDCNRGVFACFLLKYTYFKNNIVKVYDLVSTYQQQTSDLLDHIKKYTENCPKKNV